MKYACNDCKYDTNIKSHYTRHLNTPKHLERIQRTNINDNLSNSNIDKLNVTGNIIINNVVNENTSEPTPKLYKCKKCTFATKHKSSYFRHKSGCKDNGNSVDDDVNFKKIIQNFQDKLNEKDKILNEKDKIITEKDKVISQLKDDQNVYLKSLVKEAGMLVNKNTNLAIKSVSTLSYVIQNYPNAPALELVPESKYDEIAAPNCTIPITVVHYYRKKKLASYLGNYVVEFYKKEDPHLNSVWSSDVVRETFVYRELVGDKLDWIVDKVAKKIGKKIIDPMLSFIKQKLIVFNAEENKLSKNMKLSSGEMGIHVANNTDGMDITREIENDNLKHQILKYIAPFFYLNKALTFEAAEGD
jgi:hypothetical protein